MSVLKTFSPFPNCLVISREHSAVQATAYKFLFFQWIRPVKLKAKFKFEGYKKAKCFLLRLVFFLLLLLTSSSLKSLWFCSCPKLFSNCEPGVAALHRIGLAFSGKVGFHVGWMCSNVNKLPTGLSQKSDCSVSCLPLPADVHDFVGTVLG